MIEIIVDMFVAWLKMYGHWKYIYSMDMFMNFCVSAQWSNVEYQVILFTKHDESFAYDNEWALSGLIESYIFKP